MIIQNTNLKTTLQEIVKGHTYKISVLCDGTYHFSFMNKTAKSNIMVKGAISSKQPYCELTYTAPANGTLILINTPNRTWTSATITVEEI